MRGNHDDDIHSVHIPMQIQIPNFQQAIPNPNRQTNLQTQQRAKSMKSNNTTLTTWQLSTMRRGSTFVFKATIEGVGHKTGLGKLTAGSETEQSGWRSKAAS
jgi:hypothetical protein